MNWIEPSRQQASAKAGALMIVMWSGLQLEKHSVSDGVESAKGSTSRGCKGELRIAGMVCSAWNEICTAQNQTNQWIVQDRSVVS